MEGRGAEQVNRAGSRVDDVHVVGVASTAWRDEHDAMLDELVFDCVSAALREAGLRKHEVDLSVLASMDVYDARAISSAITTPAAGGYLTDSYRIEGDAGQAIVAATMAIRAGDADRAVAHSVDTVTGPIAETATVLVLEPA